LSSSGRCCSAARRPRAPVPLGIWTWWRQRRVFGRVRPFKLAAAVALPFLLLAYGGAAFTAYAIWCEVVRDVDPGIGDSWQVPIGNAHYFCMIDVTDSGYLLKGGCSGAPIVDEITELAQAGDVIAGASGSTGPFVLDTRTGAVEAVATVDAALARLPSPAPLQSAADFYTARRFGAADAIAAVLLACPALVVTVLWYRWFIRARGRRP
jgi:hypothetical protein